MINRICDICREKDAVLHLAMEGKTLEVHACQDCVNYSSVFRTIIMESNARAIVLGLLSSEESTTVSNSKLRQLLSTAMHSKQTKHILTRRDFLDPDNQAPTTATLPADHDHDPKIETLKQLQLKMAEMIKSENYEECTSLKNQIKQLEEEMEKQKKKKKKTKKGDRK